MRRTRRYGLALLSSAVVGGGALCGSAAAAPITCGSGGCTLSAGGATIALSNGADGAGGTVAELCARKGIDPADCDLLAGYADSNPISSGIGGGLFSHGLALSYYPGSSQVVLYSGTSGGAFTPQACLNLATLKAC